MKFIFIFNKKKAFYGNQSQCKAIGKKKPLIMHKSIQITDLKQFTLEELLTNIVKQQVQDFNQRTDNDNLIPFLLDETITEKSPSGKIGFNEIHNTTKADEKQAVENALLAFKDGIFCVFINDTELTSLTETITIQPNSIFTFVRLTFLSGRNW